MPSAEQHRENILEVFNKYKFINVVGGVDGCYIPFLEKPRGIPEGKDAKDFLNRKGLSSINAQIIRGFDRRIYDNLQTVHGSFHDAAVWSMLLGKRLVGEKISSTVFLGDGAFPQTEFINDDPLLGGSVEV